ncbi:MAG: hypothetical protein ACHREM_02475 [Polyangiales bacterium]
MKQDGSSNPVRLQSEADGAEAQGDPELAPEILDLLERSAAMPRGLAFVHSAPNDCVAAALGVHPETVARTCECLDSEPRAAVIREYSRAVARRSTLPPPPAPVVAEPKERGPEEVILDAEQHALGVQFLLCADLETAAITFSVHPDVVNEARDQLRLRGVHADRSTDEP